MSEPRLRMNAVWSVIGSGALQLSNLLVLLGIARLLGTESLGNFSYAIAICSPVIAFSTLGLRNLQVIEPSSRFCNDDYRRVQLIASIIAIAIISLIAVFSGRQGQALLAIIAVAVSQAISSQVDTLYAYFQKLRRLDIAARCRVINAVLMLPACLLAAYLARNLVAVVVSMLVVRWLTMRFYVDKCLHALDPDEFSRPAAWKRTRELASASLPVATMNGISTLDLSIPSLVLDSVDGAVVLGQFMVITTICLPVVFVIGNILQACLPYLSGDNSNRKKVVGGLIVSAGTLSTAAFLIVYFFGTALLAVFLGSDHAPIERQLLMSLAVGLVSLVSIILTYTLLARRQYRLCCLLSFLSCAATLIGSWYLIPRWSLSGAVVSPLAGKVLVIILAIFALQCTHSIEAKQVPSSVSGN